MVNDRVPLRHVICREEHLDKIAPASENPPLYLGISKPLNGGLTNIKGVFYLGGPTGVLLNLLILLLTISRLPVLYTLYR